VAAGILATYAFHYIKANNLEICVLATTFFVALIIGTIWGGIMLFNSAPELKSWEVKTIMKNYVGTLSSVEYIGDSTWKVRTVSIQGVDYWYFDENAVAPKGQTPTPKFKRIGNWDE
jgi:hypothetical protein